MSTGEELERHLTVKGRWDLGCTGQGRCEGSESVTGCWWEEYRNRNESEAR